MYDNLIAAALGGLSSALRYKDNWVQFLQVFISSTCLAYFAGKDLADFIAANTGIVISYMATYFILAYFGSSLLDRATLFIKAFRVSKRWGK